ncbi:hypothetical protein SARC_03408 [Sphaeroforma arctica JP610]|uniref:Cytochrome b5 heme-binding domain-containing protein n=1 Tax=Sphaeroforma arctica JP610 TaxID=667725 RepID=A0A0L0G7Z4_9EUKA|nr:hypothetical protein SARC_03408 [Sphaeroforma arctica JP610]KNC84363.1 hypothetical protein SARC_03408 [Sphaeroforma arctica JP610]|eukprot:XP_014158265.1 hypothetical protein SARC_03408 [Sphaeroforma arctica JP610]
MSGSTAPTAPNSPINWFPLVFISSFHIAFLYGAIYYPVNRTGVISCLVMYLLTGLAVTVGYHRLWSHRSYSAIAPWRLWWAFWGAGSLQGSVLWWSKLHRLHHSFPDTPADPYGPMYGFWYSHCGWLLRSPNRKQYLDKINVNDLKADWVVALQHKFYIPLNFSVAFFVPLLVWRNDPVQAFVYGGLFARILTWHSTWFVNSLAHWLGSDEYSNETSAKDHFLTALLTFGEGNHGFHHAFSFSYQNGLKWFHYDPTKSIILIASYFGITYNLKHPTDNEIQKARYQVKERKIIGMKQSIVWPDPASFKNIIALKDYEKAKEAGNIWVTMNGLVYDISSFVSQHPGGEKILAAMGSKKPEYIEHQFSFKHTHSKAARNMLDMMIIGRLEGEDSDKPLVTDAERSLGGPTVTAA